MVGLCLPFSRGFCGQKEKLRQMFCRCTFVTDQGHPLAKECVNVNVSIFVEVCQTVCWYLSRKTNEMSSLIQRHLFKQDTKSVPGFDAWTHGLACNGLSLLRIGRGDYRTASCQNNALTKIFLIQLEVYEIKARNKIYIHTSSTWNKMEWIWWKYQHWINHWSALICCNFL